MAPPDQSVRGFGSLNVQYRSRFCYIQPDEVEMPAIPGGACKLLFEEGFESANTYGWSRRVP